MVEVAVREKYLFQTFDFLHSTLRVNTPGDYATASGAGIAHVTCNAPDRAIRVHALYAMKGVKRRSPRSPLARALGPCHCRADAGRLAAARRQEEQRRKRRARASGLFIAHPTGQAAANLVKREHASQMRECRDYIQQQMCRKDGGRCDSRQRCPAENHTGNVGRSWVEKYG
ncbi:hypothetical protein [Paraburkholderia mimosarum]|uniref:hypothetical protein n=1 Tax=Paraburkholderia mimosarum TaxID=312026 RepID=UPI0012B66B09|nr:hypothetical protein [Paraburkholderia mimosarum]